MIKQFFLIFLPLFLGYCIIALTGIPIPANVVGLVLLFLGLCCGIIKLHHVDKVSDTIIKYLAVFFVVPTVGIMVYWDVIANQAVKILVPLVVSILIGFFVAGKVTELSILILEKRRIKKNKAGEITMEETK
ncbi:MAG: CidA/LrgA family protein [Anaerovorax sp.]